MTFQLKNNRGSRHRRLTLSLICGLAFSCAAVSGDPVKDNPFDKAPQMIRAESHSRSGSNNELIDQEPGPKTGAERQVFEGMINGRCVDLSGETDCTVRSGFLEWLLINTARPTHRRGVSISHAIFDGPLDLRNAEVNREVRIENSVFLGAVDLSGSHFSHDLHFNGCFFTGNIDFSGLRVDGTLELIPIPFSGTPPNERVFAETEWKADKTESTLASASESAPGDRLYQAVGVANGVRLLIDREHHRVLRKDYDASKHRESVSQVTCFWGRDNKMKDMTIERHLWLPAAIFAGPVEIFNPLVGGSVDLGRACFKKSVSFENARVKLDFNGTSAVFFGHADFSGLATGGVARFDSAQFLAPTKFDGMRVEGEAIFRQSQFTASVSFRNAVLGDFEIAGIIPPTGLGSIHLEGLCYRRIQATEGESDYGKTWENLKPRMSEFADHSPDAYERLEEFFRREGETELANEVYIENKRHERRTVLWPAIRENHWGKQLAAVWSYCLSWFRDQLTGYGRKPYLAIVPSIFIVLCGCFVFGFRKMERAEIKRKQDPRGTIDVSFLPHAFPYNCFIYSLDLFIPVLHLGYAEAWVPAGKYPWTRRWRVLQTILGWILVPLALAASSGLID